MERVRHSCTLLVTYQDSGVLKGKIIENPQKIHIFTILLAISKRIRAPMGSFYPWLSLSLTYTNKMRVANIITKLSTFIALHISWIYHYSHTEWSFTGKHQDTKSGDHMLINLCWRCREIECCHPVYRQTSMSWLRCYYQNWMSWRIYLVQIMSRTYRQYVIPSLKL